MFAVAGDGACVADAGWSVRYRGSRGRGGIAGQAGEDALAEGTEDVGAGVELLASIRGCDHTTERART